MAERSKAPESGSGPKGREFESHCCQQVFFHLSISHVQIQVEKKITQIYHSYLTNLVVVVIVIVRKSRQYENSRCINLF